MNKKYKHDTCKLNNLIYTDLFSNIFLMDYEIFYMRSSKRFLEFLQTKKTSINVKSKSRKK